MKKSRLLLMAFAIVSILYTIGIITGDITLRFGFKPLIVPILILYYIESVEQRNSLFIGALFFSFIGDVMLLYEFETNFILGLLSFLIAHILFIVMLFRMAKKSDIKLKLLALLPFVLIYALLMTYLIDDLGGMMVPVLVYGFVISLFGSLAFLNYLTTKSTMALSLFVGALLFVLSDSVLAVNKFKLSLEYFPLVVTVTYILAQFYICKFAVVKANE